MSTLSYGSITIVDITDIGEFSVTPSCNQPLTVLYDPNSGTYTPNWASSNLVITPVVYYGGRQLTTLDSDASDAVVTWQRKVNSDQAASLTTGETVTNGVLTVSASKLTISSGPTLTYICTATYHEPQSGTDVTAQGQISFTLVQNASTRKTVTISGDNIIKLNGDTNQPYGAEYVTLTATLENATMKRWQYKNSSGTWTNYPTTSGKNTSNTGTSIKVYYNEANVFVNDVCSIRAVATVVDGGASQDIYDMDQVVLLKDGASGTSNIAITLSNDDQMIPCDASGTPTTNAFSEAYSTVTVYEGGSVATGWTYNTPTASGVSGTWNSSTRTYTVSSWTGSSEVAYVEFSATKGSTTLSKRFTLTKIKTGANGVSPTIYILEANTLAANKTIGNVFTPSTVVFSAYSVTGNGGRVAYSGRYKIYKNGSSTASTTTSTDATSYTYTFASSDTQILCELWPSGGSGSALDKQTVVVTSDGQTGQPGSDGKPAISVTLGNYSDAVPCNSSGSTTAATTINIPFYGWRGGSMYACTLTSPTVNSTPITGVTVSSVTQASASGAGNIQLSVANNSNLGNASTKTFTINLDFSITADGATTSCRQVFTLFKNPAGASGQNAVFFQLYSTRTAFYDADRSDITIMSSLMDGATQVSSGVTYQWYQWNGSGYTTLSNKTSSSLVVSNEDVSSYASFKCEATYNSKTYSAYWSLQDKSDPIQVVVMSSIGDQIKNRVGTGALYVRVTRNGTELDEMYGEPTFCEAKPSPLVSGNYYYLVSNRQVSLYKATSTTAWTEQTNPHGRDGCSYAWTFRNANGEIVTTYTSNGSTYSYPTSGKVIYIDGDMVDNKIIADVTVTVS